MIEIRNLTKRIGDFTAVNDLNLRIESGEFFGLLGPNGAGKTSLFNVVSGFHKPTSGKVLFNGEEIQGKSSDEIAYLGITRTYQNIFLWR